MGGMTAEVSGSPELGGNLRVSVCCNQGGRKYMEDRVHVVCQRTPGGSLDFVFVAVYDGHGGAEASDFAKEHLLRNIVEQRGFDSNDDEDVLLAIQDGFLLTHNAMRKVVDQWARTASGFTSTAGTTASVAFIKRGKIYTGHVGDSAIVLGTAKGDTMEGRQVTVDHKPDSPQELRRISESGGEVMCKAGVMRVVWTRPMRGHVGPVRRSTPQEKIPFLAVARALGDLWSYNSNMEQFVVSPDPDVEVIPLTKDVKCLILGSDGLWNVVKAQNSVDIVNAHEWKELKEKEGSVSKSELLERNWHQNHSRWLVRSGLRAWGTLRADNLSAVTVIFDPPDARLPVYSACIQKVDLELDIEETLTSHPEAMIRLATDTTQVLKTEPVELVYSGSLDPPLSLAVANNGLGNSFGFSGPGFSNYSFQAPDRRSSAAAVLIRSSSVGSPAKAFTARTNGNSDLELTPQLSSSAVRTGIDMDEEAEEEDEGGIPLRVESVPKSPSAKSGPQARITTEKKYKPKYVCKKHGLKCEKVKKMNREYVEKLKQESPGAKQAFVIRSRAGENGRLVLPIKGRYSLRSPPTTKGASPNPITSPGTSHVRKVNVVRARRSAQFQVRLDASRSEFENGPAVRRVTRKSLPPMLSAKADDARRTKSAQGGSSKAVDGKQKKAKILVNGFSPRNGLVNPRHLTRSPIHPLPKEAAPESSLSLRSGTKRKLLLPLVSSSTEESEPESLDAPPKRSRLWNSFMSIFGSTSASTASKQI